MPELIQPSKEEDFDPYLRWEEEDEDEEGPEETVYQIPLTRCTYGVPPADGCRARRIDCGCQQAHYDGIVVLSDNEFHPGFPAWFADNLDEVSSHCGIDKESLITSLCAFEVEERVDGYSALVSYFGPYEFDQYPTSQPLEN